MSVVVCNFFEFGKVSKWCTREWVNKIKCNLNDAHIHLTLHFIKIYRHIKKKKL